VVTAVILMLHLLGQHFRFNLRSLIWLINIFISKFIRIISDFFRIVIHGSHSFSINDFRLLPGNRVFLLMCVHSSCFIRYVYHLVICKDS
jgi:hypothetical protein